LAIGKFDCIAYIDCTAIIGDQAVGSITIRKIDDAIKSSARLAAAKNGRSLEAEIRVLLERTYPPANADRAARLRAMSGPELVDHLIKVANGAELDLPARDAETIAFPEL
jgi:antitoxin FitA